MGHFKIFIVGEPNYRNVYLWSKQNGS